MAVGRVIRPEQPDPETAELPASRGPSETVPHHLRQVWAGLPRRARQRSRRRYFRAKIACADRASPTPLDARVSTLEAAVAELRSVVAALASSPSACSDSNSAPDAAGVQPAPAFTDDNPGVVPEDSRAREPVPAGIISDPLASISEPAYSHPPDSPPRKKMKQPLLALNSLAALCAADELLAEPTAEPTPTTATSRPAALLGIPMPRSHRPLRIRPGPAALPATVPHSPPDSEAHRRH